MEVLILQRSLMWRCPSYRKYNPCSNRRRVETYGLGFKHVCEIVSLCVVLTLTRIKVQVPAFVTFKCRSVTFLWASGLCRWNGLMFISNEVELNYQVRACVAVKPLCSSQSTTWSSKQILSVFFIELLYYRIILLKLNHLEPSLEHHYSVL